MGHEFMCVYTNLEGNEDLNTDLAALAARMMVSKINSACTKVALNQVSEYCEKCTTEECEATITKDNPVF